MDSKTFIFLTRKFQERSAKRKISHFTDLPTDLIIALKAFVERFDIKDLKITGSYYRGYWHNQFTQHVSPDFLTLKSAVYDIWRKEMKEESDLDVVSKVEYTGENINSKRSDIGGLKVDIKELLQWQPLTVSVRS